MPFAQGKCFSGYLKRVLQITLLLISFFTGGPASASDSLSILNTIRLGGYLNHGTITPHNNSIDYVLNSNIYGFEINLTADTYGRSAWDLLYRYPRQGIGYTYTTLGNKEIFGSAHALFGFIDVPFQRNPGRFCAFYQFSFGVSYLTRAYDIEANPLNLAISSPLNAYINLKFNGKYTVSAGSELAVGFGFMHFSNGKMGTPNLGLNSFNVSAGYFKRIGSAQVHEKVQAEFKESEKHVFDMVFSTGIKTDDNASNAMYLVTTLVADYKFFPGHKYAFGMGSDIFYDQSLGPNAADFEGSAYSQSDLVQLGMHAGVYARYSKMQMVGHVGTYIAAKYYKYARVYTRIGFRYSVSKHIFLNMTLKAHYAIADYAEWGVGYRF